MDVIDVQKEVLAEVEILGRMALFTELRVDRATVPEGMYCYDLRQTDDNKFPTALEESILVNYFGTILLRDKLELENGHLSVGYEDFSYTGEKMKIGEFLLKGKEPEPNFIQTAEELVAFLDVQDILLHMTEKEADVLLGYIEGHDYLLGEKDGRLYRGDLCYEQNSIHWEEYFIDDAIDAACEWNYDLLQMAKSERENPDDFLDFIKKDNYYKSLREDEKVLDALFDRTKYGKEIEVLAEKLADEFIQNLGKTDEVDKAVKILTDGIVKFDKGVEVREEMQYGADVFEYQGYRLNPKGSSIQKQRTFLV